MSKRVAAYCRVSTDHEDQVNSLENQIRYFTEYIEKDPEMELVEVYHDDGISGTSTAHRIHFHRMMADAEAGKIDLILTKEVSRFARNTVDTLQYVRRLKEWNVGILFLTDHIDTLDREGEFRLTMMASISQEESRKTSERVKWGQKRRMEQGVVFGRDLLGYTVKNGRLSVNPVEAEIVRLIFHKYVNEEKGTHVIARELYEAGFRPKYGKQWTNTAILRILKNEKYVGDLCQKKTFTPDFLTHKKQQNQGEEALIYLKNHHEPIIDRTTWQRAQEARKRRSPSQTRIKQKYSSRYWCSGKLICGVCGQCFVSRTKKLKNGDTYRAWRCYTSVNYGTSGFNRLGKASGCSNSSINDRVLRAAVSYCIQLTGFSGDAIQNDMLQEIQSVGRCSQTVDTSCLYRQVEGIVRKKQKAIDFALEQLISKEDLKQQNEAYDAQIASLTRQIHALEQIDEENQCTFPSIQQWQQEIHRMLNLESNDTEVYRTMLDGMVIHKDRTLVVYLKTLPFGIQLRYHSQGKQETFNVRFAYLGKDPQNWKALQSSRRAVR